MAVRNVRKKPVVIRVCGPWDGTHRSLDELSGFTGGRFRRVPQRGLQAEQGITAEVYDYLHDTWVGVKDGQSILEGTRGEYYPIDAQTLAETYDDVESPDSLDVP